MAFLRSRSVYNRPPSPSTFIIKSVLIERLIELEIFSGEHPTSRCNLTFVFVPVERLARLGGAGGVNLMALRLTGLTRCAWKTGIEFGELEDAAEDAREARVSI